MSKSTNTKDELGEIIDNLFDEGVSHCEVRHGGRRIVDGKSVVVKNLAKSQIQDFLAKDRQQLIQRIREEVIGSEEGRKLFKDEWEALAATTRDEFRQIQREILETMEKEL